VNTELTWMPSQEMYWKAWRELYPETQVLSTDTGLGRNYRNKSGPYRSYELSPTTMFPVPKYREELERKAWVVGVLVNGVPKAYSKESLKALGDKVLSDTVGGEALSITFDAQKEWANVTYTDTGEVVPHVNVYWFAWQAFYPETELDAASALTL
jgi:hypothetical protein